MAGTFSPPPLLPLAPDSYSAMREFSRTTIRGALGAGVDGTVVHLVNVRVSQLNACSFCIDMHTAEARAAGITDRRLHLLDAWRRAPGFFTGPEQAALALAEAVTLLRPGPDGPDGEELHAAVRGHFTEEQVAHLVFVATVMNAWNRLAISARLAPETDGGES